MLLLYNIGIRAYYFAVFIAAAFNKKARLWLTGRNRQCIANTADSIWFHFASLGEFEQGRPVLEAARNQYAGHPIVVTFFSPSGYEIRKNTPLADAVYYLPLDTPGNARRFIDTIKPRAAIFTKYEYWYHFFNELHRQNIPLYVISAIFRPEQIFFKWYGSLHRRMLSWVTHLFVQDERSVQLLNQLHTSHVSVSGDTRFDRVWANALQPKDLPVIARFKNGQPLFIAGSTWPPDEELIAALVPLYPDWKFIIAPHEIGEDKIARLLAQLPLVASVRFSEIEKTIKPLSDYQVLIIDNIGMLSSLYQYGNIGYIGGGFGAGIHNTLEAAAFGMPVIFGPKYEKFKEAKDLIALKAGFSIQSAQELQAITARFIAQPNELQKAGSTARAYVDKQKGATGIIMNKLNLKQ